MLGGWARRRKTAQAQALALRSRIVLACGEDGATIATVSAALEVSRSTVSKWRSRFVENRLDGLCDEQVEAVIVKTLEETPGQDTHWSTRGMAAASGMSQSAISRIWRAFGLKPHAVETWKLSTDPQFVDKVRDVVGL